MRSNQQFETGQGGAFDSIGTLVSWGLERQGTRLAILRGERDESQLTNRIFFSRHPERGGRSIGINEPHLAAEWIEIRDTVVRPILAESRGQAPAPSPVSGANVPMVLGIDYGSVDGNTNPDWARAKREGPISFAIIRATWGHFPDSVFKRDWPKIKEAGLVRGAYLFLRFPHPTSDQKYGRRPDPVTQANAFIKAVGNLEESDLPPTLDVEFPGGRGVTGMTVQQCLTDVRAAWEALADKYGVAPIIYTSARVWREDLNNVAAPDLIESPLWLTPYIVGARKPAIRDEKWFAGGKNNPPVPPPWGDASNWWIHQYQGDAIQLPGFNQVDMNRFNTTTKGATGDRVKWVQSRLGISPSGNFDDTTETAVRAFQQRKGLTVDGRIDPRTFAFLCWSNSGTWWGSINDEIRGYAPGLNPWDRLESETRDTFYEWMGEVSRSSSEYIRWVQQSLNRIQGLRLVVDGISGTLTRSAVRSCQQRAGITVDGIVGPQTESALIKFGASSPPGSSATPSAPSAPPFYGGGSGTGTPPPASGGGAGAIVTVRGIEVARSIAGNLEAMLAAAQAGGIVLTGGGYRSPQKQIDLRRQHCGPTQFDIYEKPADQCTPPTAKPGTSNHEKGLAVDFNLNGGTSNRAANLADPRFRWLQANALRFGFYNLASEAWHWSVDGR